MPRARGGVQEKTAAVGDRSPTVPAPTVGPGGVVTVKCPDCGVDQSLGALTKEGGCRMCEAPMLKFFPAEARTQQLPGTETPPATESPKTPPLPGAEPRPGDPTCEECGARLTIAGDKKFCPDISIKPHKSSQIVAAGDAPFSIKPSPATQAAVKEIVNETVLKRENAWRETMPGAENMKPWDPPTVSVDTGANPTTVHVNGAPPSSRVEVGEMAFAPQQYHSFRVGPFSMTGPVGTERKMLAHLHELQSEEFDRQLVAYQAFMSKLYGDKGKRG